MSGRNKSSPRRRPVCYVGAFLTHLLAVDVDPSLDCVHATAVAVADAHQRHMPMVELLFFLLLSIVPSGIITVSIIILVVVDVSAYLNDDGPFPAATTTTTTIIIVSAAAVAVVDRAPNFYDRTLFEVMSPRPCEGLQWLNVAGEPIDRGIGLAAFVAQEMYLDSHMRCSGVAASQQEVEERQCLQTRPQSSGS